MKKKVNGHVVEIGNMDTIEKGFEGLAMGRLVSSSLNDNLASDSEEQINECIKCYEEVSKALPFPLHAIEEDIKYAAIGTYMRDKLGKPLSMWVDKSLCISIDGARALRFVASTWAVVSIESIPEDNTNIEMYTYEVGYKEFDWALRKLMNGEKLSGYYQQFMPGFVKACGGEPLVLKWEMSRLLEFGYVPDQMNFNSDKLLDINSGSEYFLDIFSTGSRKTGETRCVIDLTRKGGTPTYEQKSNPVYDFEVYEKKKQTPEDVLTAPDVRKIQRAGMDGLAAVFQTVVGKGMFTSNVRPEYRGVIDRGTVIYEVMGSVYRCSATKYQKPIEIARNVELYAYQNGLAYIRKRAICQSGVKKESIYAYRISDGSLLICKIEYK